MPGGGDRIEEIPQNILRHYKERVNFSSLDSRKRWQDWGNSLEYFKEKTAFVLWIWGRADSIKENSSQCFKEKK